MIIRLFFHILVGLRRFKNQRDLIVSLPQRQKPPMKKEVMFT